MDSERKEHIQGMLLMGTIICLMVIVFTSLAGFETDVSIMLVSGIAGAFIAAGAVGPIDYLGMPGIRVIQGEKTPTQALAETVKHYVVLGLGFASGAFLAVQFV